MLRAREPKEDAEPKVELRLWIDFEPFSTPSGNGRFLRIPAIGPTVYEGLIAPRTQLVELETDRQISASGL